MFNRALAPFTALLLLSAPTLTACNPAGSVQGHAEDEATSDGGDSNDDDPGAGSGAGSGTGTGPGADTGGEPPATTGSGGGPVCGDGQLDPGEMCDGAAPFSMECADVDPALTGPLACGGDCQSFDTSSCTPLGTARVVLNEVTSKPATFGPYAGKGDAIELLNAGDAAADLSGWKLSDDPTFLPEKTYVFAQGVTLAPGAMLVLVEFDVMTGQGDLPFGISSMGEEKLALVDAGAAVIDSLVVQGADAAVSYCRLPDGDGAWQLCDQTLGGPNAAASQICGNATLEGDEGCDAADLGGKACQDFGFTGGQLGCTAACAVDTSMCQSDTPVALNELEVTDDRIEIYNAGDKTIDVTGWILTDAVVDGAYKPADDVKKLVFPGVTTIPAKQFLVVDKGDLPGQHPFGLSAEGDKVTLMKPDLTLVSQVSYGLIQEGPTSYCRTPDGPDGGWSAGCTPTFGGANQKP